MNVYILDKFVQPLIIIYRSHCNFRLQSDHTDFLSSVFITLQQC